MKEITTDNIITDLHASLLLSKTQVEFDGKVINWILYVAKPDYRYNFNSFFTEKQQQWKDKFIESIINIAKMRTIFFEIDINEAQTNFRKRMR